MATTFDPFRDLDRLLGGAVRNPASAAMPMDLYRKGEQFIAHVAVAVSRTPCRHLRPAGDVGVRGRAGQDRSRHLDGVLTLTIPVAEESESRKISVSHTGNQHAIEGVSSGTNQDEDNK